VVTNHDVFGHYIDRYGLEFVGSIITSFDTSTELSEGDIRDLVAESVREAEQPIRTLRERLPLLKHASARPRPLEGWHNSPQRISAGRLPNRG
jgi:hypothetical protein